jgi:hypothetical protein
MKVALIAVASAVVMFAVLAWFLFGRADAPAPIRGTSSDLPKYLAALQSAPEGAWLRVHVGGGEDFLQFSADDGVVQMDLPVITDRQKQVAGEYRRVAESLNLSVQETVGTDGSLFLDIDLADSPFQMANAVKQMLTALYGADGKTELEFVCADFALEHG